MDADVFPSEILSEIFIALYGSQALAEDKLGPKLSSWLPILHVCRKWRMVACSTPLLWTIIPLAHEHLMDLSLERFKGLSLSIAAPNAYLHSSRALFKALEHLPSIRNIHIGLQSLSSDLVTPYLQQPAPALYSLALMGKRAHVDLPNLLFQQQVPALRVLRLHNASFSWQSPFLRNLHNLTSLEIVDPLKKVTATTVLKALEHLPLLRHLALVNAFVFSNQQAINSFTIFTFADHTVTLPYLESLTLDDHQHEQYFLLFCSLKIIQRPRLTFKIYFQRSDFHFIQLLLSKLSRTYGPPFPITKLSASFDDEDESYHIVAHNSHHQAIVFDFWLFSENDADSVFLPHPFAWFCYSIDFCDTGIQCFKLLEEVDLSGIREAATSRHDAECFIDRFESIPLLHTLKLHGMIASNVLKYLMYDLDKAAEGARAPRFPALRVLHVENIVAGLDGHGSAHERLIRRRLLPGRAATIETVIVEHNGNLAASDQARLKIAIPHVSFIRNEKVDWEALEAEEEDNKEIDGDEESEDGDDEEDEDEDEDESTDNDDENVL